MVGSLAAELRGYLSAQLAAWLPDGLAAWLPGCMAAWLGEGKISSMNASEETSLRDTRGSSQS